MISKNTQENINQTTSQLLKEWSNELKRDVTYRGEITNVENNVYTIDIRGVIYKITDQSNKYTKGDIVYVLFRQGELDASFATIISKEHINTISASAQKYLIVPCPFLNFQGNKVLASGNSSVSLLEYQPQDKPFNMIKATMTCKSGADFSNGIKVKISIEFEDNSVYNCYWTEKDILGKSKNFIFDAINTKFFILPGAVRVQTIRIISEKVGSQQTAQDIDDLAFEIKAGYNATNDANYTFYTFSNCNDYEKGSSSLNIQINVQYKENSMIKTFKETTNIQSAVPGASSSQDSIEYVDYYPNQEDKQKTISRVWLAYDYLARFSNTKFYYKSGIYSPANITVYTYIGYPSTGQQKTSSIDRSKITVSPSEVASGLPSTGSVGSFTVTPNNIENITITIHNQEYILPIENIEGKYSLNIDNPFDLVLVSQPDIYNRYLPISVSDINTQWPGCKHTLEVREKGDTIHIGAIVTAVNNASDQNRVVYSIVANTNTGALPIQITESSSLRLDIAADNKTIDLKGYFTDSINSYKVSYNFYKANSTEPIAANDFIALKDVGTLDYNIKCSPTIIFTDNQPDTITCTGYYVQNGTDTIELGSSSHTIPNVQWYVDSNNITTTDSSQNIYLSNKRLIIKNNAVNFNDSILVSLQNLGKIYDKQIISKPMRNNMITIDNQIFKKSTEGNWYELISCPIYKIGISQTSSPHSYGNIELKDYIIDDISINRIIDFEVTTEETISLSQSTTVSFVNDDVPFITRNNNQWSAIELENGNNKGRIAFSVECNNSDTSYSTWNNTSGVQSVNNSNSSDSILNVFYDRTTKTIKCCVTKDSIRAVTITFESFLYNNKLNLWYKVAQQSYIYYIQSSSTYQGKKPKTETVPTNTDSFESETLPAYPAEIEYNSTDSYFDFSFKDQILTTFGLFGGPFAGKIRIVSDTSQLANFPNDIFFVLDQRSDL